MPTIQRGDATIYYEERGSGPPLLLLAPGGLNSPRRDSPAPTPKEELVCTLCRLSACWTPKPAIHRTTR